MPALPPFDRQDATLIICSSDFIDFRLHKEALILASSHFERLLKTPPNSCSFDSLPQYDLPEDSETLDNLFRFIYPIGKPPMTEIRVVGKVLKAAVKYEMKQVEMEMRDHLERMAAKDPMTVYAIACQLNLEAEASVAANYAIGRKDLGYVPDLDNIAAGPYFRFVEFISAEVPVYRESGQDLGGGSPLVSRKLFIAPPDPDSHRSRGSSGERKFRVFDPMQIVSSRLPPDVILRSSDGLHIKAHRIFLIMTSCIFSGLLDGIPTPQQNGGVLPILPLDMESRLLSKLVSLCYPMSEPSMDTIDDLVELVDIALKFELKSVHNMARREIMRLVEAEQDPLRVYYICIRLGWYEEARYIAQRFSVLRSVEKYYPEMEHVPAWAYFNLREYHSRCRVLLSDMLHAHGRTLYSTENYVGFLESYHKLRDHTKSMEAIVERAIEDETLQFGISELARPPPPFTRHV